MNGQHTTIDVSGTELRELVVLVGGLRREMMKLFWAIAIITAFTVGAGLLNALYMVGGLR